GFLHDGSVPTLFDFNASIVFDITPENPGGFPADASGDLLRTQVADFMLAFDSNMAPVVGQQATLTNRNERAAGSRIELLMERAEAGECELIVKGHGSGRELGYLYVGSDKFVSNRACDDVISDRKLRSLAKASAKALTYTCVPPGSGRRMAIDRDLDGA